MNVVSFQPPPPPLLLWLEYCADRGLTPEVLAPMKGELLTLDHASKIMGTGIFGFKKLGAVGAFVFQLAPGEYQARILYGPPPDVAPVGAVAKDLKQTKYWRPKYSTNVLYVPPHLTDWYKPDVRYNLLIVEGALNAVRLAAQGYHAVAITGVYNHHVGGKSSPIIPELRNFVQSVQAERITILFDSDTGDPDSNPQLWVGLNSLAQDLLKMRPERRDTLYICRPPPRVNGEKNGPDDYLHSAGLDAFNELLHDRSEQYSDHPFYRVEAEAVRRFIAEESTGTVFDTKIRRSVNEQHANLNLTVYGKVMDITSLSNRPVVGPYTVKHLMAAPGLRRAQGKRYQPDTDDQFFLDDTEIPPRYYVNLFQPEDLPTPIKGDVSMFYKMLNSICRHTPTAVEKFMTIAAKHAQYPALVPKYAILMTGQQGSGKSLMAKCVGLALAKKFNSARVDLRLSYNSEWRGFACKEWPEFDRGMDVEWAKDLITGETYLVSTKYGQNYEDRNHTLNIFTCNGLKATIQEGDRRFLVCGEAKADDKILGLQFEAWVNGTGPQHLRWHLLNEVDCSGYDLLDVWTEMKASVIEASKSYRSTACDFVLEDLADIEGLECIPNKFLQILVDVHKIPLNEFNKEFGQVFIKPAKPIIKINGVAERFRAFKNHEKWMKEEDTEEYRKQYALAEEIMKGRKFSP